MSENETTLPSFATSAGLGILNAYPNVSIAWAPAISPASGKGSFSGPLQTALEANGIKILDAGTIDPVLLADFTQRYGGATPFAVSSAAEATLAAEYAARGASVQTQVNFLDGARRSDVVATEWGWLGGDQALVESKVGYSTATQSNLSQIGKDISIAAESGVWRVAGQALVAAGIAADAASTTYTLSNELQAGDYVAASETGALFVAREVGAVVGGAFGAVVGSPVPVVGAAAGAVGGAYAGSELLQGAVKFGFDLALGRLVYTGNEGESSLGIADPSGLSTAFTQPAQLSSLNNQTTAISGGVISPTTMTSSPATLQGSSLPNLPLDLGSSTLAASPPSPPPSNPSPPSAASTFVDYGPSPAYVPPAFSNPVDDVPLSTATFEPIDVSSFASSSPSSMTSYDPVSSLYNNFGGASNYEGSSINFMTQTMPSVSISDFGMTLNIGGDSGYPVVLDLTGNGIKITPLSSSNMFFDMANDGSQQQTAWAGAGNGVLVYNPTGGASIRQANQVEFTLWDPTATNDMQALADVFDTNHNGKLDSGDAAFTSFQILVTNADGTFIAHHVDETGKEFLTEHLASDGDTVLDAHGISAAGKTWSETVTNGQIAASFGGQQVNWSDAAVAGAGALGSAIGNALGGNNLALKIAGSTIIGTMSHDLAVALVNGSNTIVTGEAAAAGMGDGIGAAMGSAFGTFGVNLANNANGEVSGLLVGEAAQALGLKGFGAGLFNTVGTTITSTLIRSAYGTLTTGIDFGTELATNFGDKFIVGMEANIGGFLGSYLGAALVPATSQAAAIGGSIGSAVGTAIGATASVTAAIEATVIGEAFTAAIPFIGPFLAPFLGAFVGQILGTLFGGLFASGPPKATVAAGVDFSTGQARVVYQSTKNGGDPTFILGLAQSVSNEINAIVGATGGKIVAESANNYIEFYQKDSNIRVTGFDSQQTNYNAPSTNSAIWANIVDANAFGLIKGASVANGDIVLEAALGSALHKDGALSEIATDLQVAKDYETYLANSDAIDTLMAANPDSSFTAGWTLTLLRAKELGLNLLTVQSGWTATLSGDSEKVYDAKGALVEELDFSATGVAAPFYYYDKRTVSSSNSVIHVANGATVTVTGSGNIIDAGLRANVIVAGDGNSVTLAQGATATISGKSETIKAAGATVNVGSNGSATINGDSATVNVGTNANATLTGRGANIYVNGTDDVLSASNAVIRLAANTWTHNIAGDGNQIIAQGAGVAVGVSGRGDQVTLQANSGSAVGLNGVDGLTINATGDNVYVNSSNTGTQLNGSGNNVVVTGVGNSLTATNNSIDIANNSFLNLAGGFDNVRLGGIGAYLGLLGGSGYNVSGSNATIGTLGGTSLNLSGGNDTVGLGGTGDYLGVLSGSGHMVTGSGNLINVVSGAGVSFLGSSNVINGGTNVSLAVTGNYNTIAAGSGSTISLGAGTNTLYTSNNRVTLLIGASATVNGNGDTVVQTKNSWMQVNGSVGWVDITGGGNTTNVNSAWVVLENGASTTLNGNSNTANLNSWAYVNATGAWDTINVNGVGDAAALNNGTLNIADGSVVTVWGSGDRINVGSNVILKVLGSNNVITFGNLSLIGVNGSSNAISADNNVSVALVGNSNSVSLGSQVSVGASGSSDLFKIGNQANIAVRGNQNTVISGIQSDIVISGILDTVQAGSQSMVGAAGSRNSVSVGAGSSIGMGGQQSALLNQMDQIVNAMSGFSAPDPTMLNIPLIGQATAPIQLAATQH